MSSLDVLDLVAPGPVDLPDLAGAPDLLPLDAGDHVRFTFAMESCIGCHACEVACAEENSTPVGVAWRRVGEVEGGSFPETRRHSVSMGCNHCLEPACLIGCPTNAYIKADNGVVIHQQSECVGCGYCTWTCPYEVPKFDPAKGVVSKCNLCQPRLEAGQDPACVNACPTRALGVERVDPDVWRGDHSGADAPGLPPSALTVSTTRFVLPADLRDDVSGVDADHARPADPHWPLILLTLLSQVAVGALCVTTALALAIRLGVVGLGGAGRGGLGLAGTGLGLGGAGISGSAGSPGTAGLVGGLWAAAAVGAVAMVASVFHLGRPGRAWKAMRNLRRSWLSREVALLSAFAGLAGGAALVATVVGPGAPLSLGLEVAGSLVGVAGLYASARLYRIPARPAWDSPRTVVSFLATALAMGPLVVLVVLTGGGLVGGLPGGGSVLTAGGGLTGGGSVLTAGGGRVLVGLAAGGLVLGLGCLGHLMSGVARQSARELRLTSRLLFGPMRFLVAARVATGLAGLAGCGWVLLAPTAGPLGPSRLGEALTLGGILALAGLSELVGRYLFYVSVTSMTAARGWWGPR